MSKSLTSSLQVLQRCERYTAQRCAYSAASRRLDNPSSPHRLRQGATAARSLTTSVPRHASQMGRAIKPAGGSNKSAPSMALAMKKQSAEMMRAGQMPDDLGLLPDTLVMPTGQRLPAVHKDFRTRWLLEKKRLRTRFVELYSSWAYKWLMVKPRPILGMGKIPGIAQELHKEIYTHFAEGNLQPVESRVCEGFLSSLRRRISQRAPGMSLRWTVHKYLSPPKLVSYKVSLFPQPQGKKAAPAEQNGITQAVVRIQSSQSLQHLKRVHERDSSGKLRERQVLVDAQGKELPERDPEFVPRDAKETTEYFVVQKSLRNNKEGNWMVWGTTEETPMEKLRVKDGRSLRKMLRPETAVGL